MNLFTENESYWGVNCTVNTSYLQNSNSQVFHSLVLESVYIGVPVPQGYRRKRRHHRHTSRHSHDREGRQKHHNRHEHQDREEPCDADEGEQDSNELSDINSASELLLTSYYSADITKMFYGNYSFYQNTIIKYSSKLF